MNKIIMLIGILFLMSTSAIAEEVEFNMCECVAEVKEEGFTKKESSDICLDRLIDILMDKSEKSGNIETANIIGC